VTQYPAVFEAERPVRFERAHVFLRIALLGVTSALFGPFGAFGILYLCVPLAVAILVGQRGNARWAGEDGREVSEWVSFFVSLLAYVAAVTDRLPGQETGARFAVVPSGAPTIGSALLRIVTALPSAIVLSLLVFVSVLVWLVAAVSILIAAGYPELLWRFQRAIVRWEARLLAYLASLVDAYPPFRLGL
jgi:hypothetical protein